MFLITGKILSLDDPAKVGQMLGMYMITVLVGLVLHAAVTLPLIYFVIVRKNPLTVFIGVLQAWITAIGTASRWVSLVGQYTISMLHNPSRTHAGSVIPLISFICKLASFA